MERMDKSRTEKQVEELRQGIYDFMVEYEDKTGHPPAVRLICAAFEIPSTSNVLYHQRAMVELGMLQEVAPRGYPYRLRTVRDEVSE